MDNHNHTKSYESTDKIFLDLLAHNNEDVNNIIKNHLNNITSLQELLVLEETKLNNCLTQQFFNAN